MVEQSQEVAFLMQGNADAMANRQRLATLAGPSLETPDNHQKAAGVFSQLTYTRLSFNFERRNILRGAFPEVYSDASKFVDHTNQAPWTVVDLGETEDIQLIGVKYGVAYSRRRPLYPEEISPMTEVFYQCAEVELDHREMYSPRNLDATLKSIRDRELEADAKLSQWIESLPPEEREVLKVTDEDRQFAENMRAFTDWGKNSEKPASEG